MNDRIKANYEKDLKQKARDMEEMEKKLAQEQAALEKAEEKRRREATAKAEAARKAALQPAASSVAPAAARAVMRQSHQPSRRRHLRMEENEFVRSRCRQCRCHVRRQS